MTNDAELTGLLTQVNKAVAGDGTLSKDDVYRAMKRISTRLAEKNETPERAFVRLFTKRDSPGVAVFRAYQQPSPPVASNNIAKALAPND